MKTIYAEKRVKQFMSDTMPVGSEKEDRRSGKAETGRKVGRSSCVGQMLDFPIMIQPKSCVNCRFETIFYKKRQYK